ncbi:MAG TPA: hypothetical protein VFZ70_18590 [Euzebyales bacterium]
MDGNDGQDRAAKAFEQTAKAFEQAAKAFEQTAGAFEPSRPRAERSSSPQPPDPQPVRDQGRQLREFVQAAIIGVALGLVIHFGLPPVGDDGEPYTGVGDGLVFARCDEPVLGLFQPSVELWQVSDDDLRVGDGDGNIEVQKHHEVDLPAHSRLAYSCDTVGGLARRLFDDDFTHTVVTIRTPSTGAERVHLVDLTGREEPRQLSPEPDAEYAPLPHDDLAVFGPDNDTVWYRSANDETVYSAAIGGGEPSPVALLNADAVAFTVFDAAERRILAQGDPSADHYTVELALPNPIGDLAVTTRTLYTADEGDPVRLTCEVFVDAPDLCGGRAGIAAVTVRPAAWLDDRTLIAIADPAGEGNTLVRVEIDELDRLWACPAVPPSDWTHLSVAGAPDGDEFVTVAERNGERKLFAKSTFADGDEPPIEGATLTLPGDARLVAWTSAVAERSIVPQICATE